MPPTLRYLAICLVAHAALMSADSLAQVPPERPSRKASEESHREIHSTDLVGVWEAIDVKSLKTFVADIRGQTYESFVSIVGSEALVFSVHSLTTKGHHIELLGDGRGNAWAYSLKITADGWAGAGEGVLDATIVLRDSDGKRIFNTWRVPLYGYRGKFVETFCEAKRSSDDAIAKARVDSQRKDAPTPERR